MVVKKMKDRLSKNRVRPPVQSCNFSSRMQDQTGKIRFIRIFDELRRDYVKKWLDA